MALETQYLSLGPLPPLSTQVITFDGKINKDQVGVVLQGFGFSFNDSSGSYAHHPTEFLNSQSLGILRAERAALSMSRSPRLKSEIKDL